MHASGRLPLVQKFQLLCMAFAKMLLFSLFHFFFHLSIIFTFPVKCTTTRTLLTYSACLIKVRRKLTEVVVANYAVLRKPINEKNCLLESKSEFDYVLVNEGTVHRGIWKLLRTCLGKRKKKKKKKLI